MYEASGERSAGRNDAHGHGTDDATLDATISDGVHCCECWRYTDDLHTYDRTVQHAVEVIVNGSTLCVEKSAAFAAADRFLARVFDNATASHTVAGGAGEGSVDSKSGGGTNTLALPKWGDR